MAKNKYNATQTQNRVEAIKNVVLSKKDNETRELLEKRFVGKALIVSPDKPERFDLNRAYNDMFLTEENYAGNKNLVIKDKLNAFILEQVVNKLNNGQVISITALSNAISHQDNEYIKELYKRNGELNYFSELANYANNTCKGIKDVAQSLIGISKKDTMIDRVVELLSRVDLINSTMDDFRDEFHEINIILESIAQSEEGQIRSFNEILDDWLDLIYQRKLGTVDSRTLTLGDKDIPEDERNFVGLDEKIGGFREGQMVVIAARPGVGKTAFILNMAQAFLAQQNGKSEAGQTKTRPVSGVFFSLEMSSYDLVERMVANSTGTTVKELRSNDVSDKTWQAVQAYIESDEIQERLYINDDPSLKMIDIQDDIDKLIRKGVNVDFVVIDYLQLINTDSFNRQQAVAAISRQLKIIAKKYNTVVFALSQLNRDIESRVNKMPTLADLRESGQIEQDADIVLMLSPEVETTETEEESNFLEAASLEQNNITVEENPEIIVDLTIAKNRAGSCGVIKYIFDRPYQSFVEAIPNDFDPNEVFGEDEQDKLISTPKSEEGVNVNENENENVIKNDDLMQDFGFGKNNDIKEDQSKHSENIDQVDQIDQAEKTEQNSVKNIDADIDVKQDIKQENSNQEEVKQNVDKSIDLDADDLINSVISNVSNDSEEQNKTADSDSTGDELINNILSNFGEDEDDSSNSKDKSNEQDDLDKFKQNDDFWVDADKFENEDGVTMLDISNSDLGF